MSRGPILTATLLSICLSWTAGSGAPRCWAQSGRSGMERSAPYQQGKSLASRLQALGRSFQLKESPDADRSPSAQEKQTKKKRMDPSKQTPSKGHRSRGTGQTQTSQSKSAQLKSAKPLLPGFHTENLIPSGFFFMGKQQSKEATQQRGSSKQHHSKKKRGPSTKSHSGRNNNRQSQNGDDRSAAGSLRKPSMGEPLRVARRSPKLRSTRDELESALSELVSDHQESQPESQAITPPSAADSRPLPGFLGEHLEAESSDADSRPATGHQLVDQSERHLSPSAPADLAQNGLRQTGSSPSRSFDLREVLLSEACPGNPTIAGMDADGSGSVANTNEPSLNSNVADGSGSDAKTTEPPTHFTQPMAGQDEDGQGSFEIPSMNESSEQDAGKPLDGRSAGLARAENHLRAHGQEASIPRRTTSTTRPTTDEEHGARSEGQPLAAGQLPGRQSQVLLTTRQPVIVSRVEGPQKILVGRESQYHVVLQNQGDAAAEQLTAKIHVPTWAEIVDTTSTGGTVQPAEAPTAEQAKPVAGEGQQILQWHLSQLKPEDSQTLHLRLVPRSGRPMHLGVNWTHAPVRSSTVVEVQEPKLRMTLSGPTDVLYGKAQRYRLVLHNPGTGVAEEVTIHLLPPGETVGSETNHAIGSLEPGATKEVELELTARQAGELEVKATAIAAGDLRTETVKKVFCRKAELALDWRGPGSKYAGTESTYYLRVRNPGSALTDPLVVKVQLPTGAKLVGASDGQSHDAKQNCVTWQLAGLSPKEEQFMQLRCKHNKPGPNSMQFTAKTVAGDLSDMKTIQTNVVAIADLKLTVGDPKGPYPVDEPAIYEIRVANRGTSKAENVQIVALFSEGIEPTEVEGNEYTIRDGRVSFKPLRSIAAGSELVLEIRAQASQPGTHVFRAEVLCQELDIKLTAQETTRFFEDTWAGGNTPYTAGLEEAEETVRQ